MEVFNDLLKKAELIRLLEKESKVRCKELEVELTKIEDVPGNDKEYDELKLKQRDLEQINTWIEKLKRCDDILGISSLCVETWQKALFADVSNSLYFIK